MNLTLPLIINQSQAVKGQVETLLMWINKWIYGECTFKLENEKILKAISAPTREQEIINANARFIHKVINQKKVGSLLKLITSTARSTARFHHIAPKKKLYRTAFEYHLQLFNQLPNDIKFVKPLTFKKKLWNIKIEFKPQD